MSYRDDLASALARIEALEQMLGGASSDASDLASENKRIRGEAAKLKQELVGARAKVRELSERLYGEPKPASELEKMHTLTEHNSQFPVPEQMPTVPVLCPQCITTGDRVQMARIRADLIGSEGTTVLCWSCGTVGTMRYK